MLTRSRAAAAAGCTLIAILLAAWRPPLVQTLDLLAYDTLTRPDAARPQRTHVAILAIDEASIGALGQWPWSRARMATIVDSLTRLGARVVALDLLLADPERTAANGAQDDMLAVPDAALAIALSRSPTVVGYAFTFDERPTGATCLLHPLPTATRDAGGADAGGALFSASGVLCTLRTLTEAAGQSGFINAAADIDGLMRRVPMLIRYGDRTYPSLALAAVRRAEHGAAAMVNRNPDGRLLLQVGRHHAPLDASGRALIRFARAGAFPYISAVDVVTGRVEAAAVRDRIVFVGPTAIGLLDLVATPFDRAFPGVEVHATVAQALLDGTLVTRAANAEVWEVASAVVIGLAAIGLMAAFGQVAGIVSVVALVAAVWFGAGVWLERTGVYWSPLFATLAAIVGAALDSGLGVIRERRRADHENRRREQAQRLIVQTLTSLTETRDSYTGRHARRTQRYTHILATSLAAMPRYERVLTRARIDTIARLAPLHDIGKVGVSDAVLNKPGPLTPTERQEIELHPVLGHDSLVRAEMLAGAYQDDVLAVAKEIVHTHHEHWDGTGYPRGLRGEAIPLSGRVVALVDVYDALVDERPYRRGLTHDRAREIIVQGRAKHFDPDVVDAFLRVEDDFRRVATNTAGDAPVGQN